MGKTLGITAFVFLMISFPLPLVGNYVSLLALLVASGAALAGDRTWAVVVALVGGVKQFFLSPTWMFMMYSHRIAEGFDTPYGHAVAAQQRGTNTGFFYLTLVLVLAPLAVVGWKTLQSASPPNSPEE